MWSFTHRIKKRQMTMYIRASDSSHTELTRKKRRSILRELDPLHTGSIGNKRRSAKGHSILYTRDQQETKDDWYKSKWSSTHNINTKQKAIDLRVSDPSHSRSNKKQKAIDLRARDPSHKKVISIFNLTVGIITLHILYNSSFVDNCRSG